MSKPPPKGSAVRESSRSYYAVGRDFYDDEYSDCSSIASVDEKLNFSQPIPREKELRVLQEAYQQSLKPKESAESPTGARKSPGICLIQGHSGVGKSTLFKLFAESVQASGDNNNNGGQIPYILKGKFQEMSSEDPLSAIAEAFDGLAATLLQQQQSAEMNDNRDARAEVDKLLQKIITRIGGLEAAAHLCTIVPRLEPLFASVAINFASDQISVSSMSWNNHGSHQNSNNETGFSTASTAGSQTRRDAGKAWNRVKYMFRAFATVLTRHRPVILFLDDLQWSDKASMELIYDLVLDKNLNNFFLVGAYRTSDDDEEEGGGGSIDDYRDHRWDFVQNIQQSNIPTIQLDNLSLDGLCQFLRIVLQLQHEEEEQEEEEEAADSSRLEELAQALYQKTNGNIFFTRNVLEELHSKRLLSFSHLTFTWEWDLNQIPLLDNVLDAVTRRIQSRSKKSPLLRKLLIQIAYLCRNKVSKDCLQYLVNHHNADDRQISELGVIFELDKAVSDGFLVRDAADGKMYGFSHDRIREAAYRLIPEGEQRDRFRHKIGSLLYEMSQDLTLGQDWMILGAADHLNASTPTVKDMEEAVFLTKLNYEAAERCVGMAAFDSASTYSEVAMKHLQNNTQKGDPWTFHYELTLEVFSLRVDAELARGNWDVGYKVAEEVLERARTINDRLPTQLAYSKALGRQKSHDDSFQSTLQTLQEMGLYPKSSLGVFLGLLRDLMFVKRYFKTNSDEDVLAMPVCLDMKLSIATELFGSGIHQCIFTGNIKDLVAMALKALRLSIENGQFAQTGRMVSAYSFVVDALGDYKGVCRLSNLALTMANQSPDRTMYGWLLYSRLVFIDSWYKSPKEMAELYDASYKRSMESGDYESALISQATALDHEFLAGNALPLIDLRFKDLVERQQMYAESMVRVTSQQWLPVRHLRGTIDTPLDFDTLGSFDAADPDKIYLIACFASCLIIAVYWSNYEFAETILSKAGPVNDNGYTSRVPRLFFVNIVYSTLYRTNGNRSYRKKGKAAAADLRKLSEQRGMNSWHRVTIMNAHTKACSRKGKPKVKDVLAEYDKGIEASLKCHHKHDAALASQLAAEFLLWVLETGDADNSHSSAIEKYLRDARGWYRDWGASNLVRHLEQKHSEYLQSGR